MTSPSSPLGRNAAVAGLLFQSAPLVGVVVTARGMIRAFQTLGSDGLDDPSGLAGAIGATLTATATGFYIGFIGLALIGYALFGARYRALWFFRSLVAVSALWILLFPLGTIFGLSLLICLVIKKEEFRPPSAGSG